MLLLVGLALAEGPPRIVGGSLVPQGVHPAVAGIVFADGNVRCTGVLVHPEVVLTAAHCVDANPVSVVLDTVNWRSPGGTWVGIAEAYVHPDYAPDDLYAGPDLAALVLTEPVLVPPVPLASACLQPWVVDGAPVQLVGFGATEEDGSGLRSALRQGRTALVDASCASDVLDELETGCIDALRPDGELIAGGGLDLDGDGLPDPVVDSCVGDSGGPLLLPTDWGDAVLALTSRSLLGVDLQGGDPCGDGGVYVRVDGRLAWLETVTGRTLATVACNEPPTLDPVVLRVRPGRSVQVELTVLDPDSTELVVELLDEPSLGQVTVEGTSLRFDGGRSEGRETLRLRVGDGGSDVAASRSLSTETDLTLVVEREGCGCAAVASAGSWWDLLRRRPLTRARR